MVQRTKKQCSIDECVNIHIAKGLCRKHYQQQLKKTNPKCSVNTCEASAVARGLCSAHHKRWLKSGDLQENTPVLERHSSPFKSFLSRIKRVNGHLLWTGVRNGAGYGRISVNGKKIYAHRYTWEQINGPIPEGMEIDHICHTPQCVEISHLRLASRPSNGANMSGPDKGSSSGVRNVHKSGEKWVVVVKRHGIAHSFGRYNTVEEAAVIAEKARQELFGDFAGKG